MALTNFCLRGAAWYHRDGHPLGAATDGAVATSSASRSRRVRHCFRWQPLQDQREINKKCANGLSLEPKWLRKVVVMVVVVCVGGVGVGVGVVLTGE